MSDIPPRPGPRHASLPWRTLAIAFGCTLLGAALGSLAAWAWDARQSPAARLAAGDRAAIEQVVQDTLLAHPEILPKALAVLEQRRAAEQVGALRPQLERPAPGAVLGNPAGRVTLVAFTDYACGYCRASVPDVDALIAANPDLRVVVREWPILSPASGDAARMALAAAAQGRYAAFHQAMFASGRPSPATIAAAARAAGLDPDRARQTIAAPATDAELARNLELARALGFNGTPAWVVGDTVLNGAVGRAALAEAIARARG